MTSSHRRCRRIDVHIVARIDLMLHNVVPPAVVVARSLIEVVHVRVAPVRRQHVVEVKDEHVFVGVVFEPVVDQPLVERTSVVCVGWIA